MECKICGKEFVQTHGNQRCCSKECKYENKIKANREWEASKKNSTASEKYNEIRQAYMRSNDKEILSI